MIDGSIFPTDPTSDLFMFACCLHEGEMELDYTDAPGGFGVHAQAIPYFHSASEHPNLPSSIDHKPTCSIVLALNLTPL